MARVASPVDANYPYAGAGGQLFGGTELELIRHLALLVEGEFDAGPLDVSLDPGTRIDTRARSVHAILDLVLHF